ncbi:MAG: TonB-dependent receptor [Opitutaceae bacterium]|nr:TonB-dependent receptor [Opitutaceae bacterium]
MSRYYRNLWEDRDNYRMRNELVALFQTWGWDHKIIVGQSWFALRTKTLQYNTNTSLASYADSPSADRFPALDLVTGERVNLLTGEVMAAPPEIVYRANPAVDRTQRAGTRSYYANDLVTLVPGRLIVQAGVRYIENIWKVDNRAEPEDSYARVPEDDITHSLGVVWHLTPNKAWTLYANRTEAFQPNIQMDHAADDSEPVPLKSQTGIQYEAGVKYVWRDKFTSLLSWYDIMQNNVAASYAAYTPLPEGGMSSVRTRWRTIDGIHSRGFEAGFNWRASPALSVFGGYAYTHTVNEDKETGGGRHYRVPLHAVSLFGRYAVKRGPLAGLSFNCGFVWRDITLPQDRGGDPAQRPMWTVPPYLSIDLGATYAVKLSKKVRATLSARAANITDHLNYLNTNNLYTSITAPRTFTLGAGLSF